MPVDEPGADSVFRQLFEANRILNVHWTRATDNPWRIGGCFECQGRNNCKQLDWSIGIITEVWATMLSK